MFDLSVSHRLCDSPAAIINDQLSTQQPLATVIRSSMWIMQKAAGPKLWRIFELYPFPWKAGTCKFNHQLMFNNTAHTYSSQIIADFTSQIT